MSASLDRYRVLVTASAHAAVADAVVEAELGAAALASNASVWGNLYTDAMVYLAAHNVQTFHVDSANTSGGALTQQRDGDLSRSHASTAQGDADDWLRTTKYGLRYLHYRSMVAGMPHLVSVGT